ncbi:hypothetical protein Mame01_12560 [Microbispora amethystogenes]|nr:hypothetical protein Mame01_12560 [Microbispora amethystogenes]
MLPESAAVNLSGEVRRYTPSASCTTMSPDMEPFCDRTAVCAASREHGSAEEQALPVPEGDTYRVVVAARAGIAGAAAAVAAATAAAIPVTSGLSTAARGKRPCRRGLSRWFTCSPGSARRVSWWAEDAGQAGQASARGRRPGRVTEGPMA